MKSDMAPLGTSPRLNRRRDNSTKTLRLVIMGATHVGKTSIIKRYIDDEFHGKYKETIEELYTKQNAHVENNHHVDVEILDTSGAISFPDMRRLAIKSADVIMLVFSVQDELSYEKCLEIRQEVLDVRSDIPIVFVANQIDCGDKIVLHREIIELSVDIELNCPYVEVSAKTGENIDSAFVACIRHTQK